MTAEHASIATYLLIDSAMMPTNLRLHLAESSTRPAWMIAIYKPQAESVSPYVIDIAAAYAAGDIDVVMVLANAVRPQLHASFIDSALSHADITLRLRHFIMIRDQAGKAWTLRFADGSALVALAAIFSAPQWRAITLYIERWQVHGREGERITLPSAAPHVEAEPTPLNLAPYQCAALEEWCAPDGMVATRREMHPGEEIPRTGAELHRWATQARALWWLVPHADAIVLRWLTMAAIDTRGELFRMRELDAILANTEPAAIRAGLRAAVARYRDSLNKALPEAPWDS